MLTRKLEQRPLLKWLIVIACVVVSTGAFLYFFERAPIEGQGTQFALDWKDLWGGLRGGQLNYEPLGFRAAPWSMIPMLPLGLLSMRGSWGMINLLTFAVLVLSVPRHPDRLRFVAGVVLLAASYPALRHAVDGNWEGLIIAGTLLTLIGFNRQKPLIMAAGLILATAKPQETVLLMIVLAVYLLQVWPVREWLKLGGLLALIVVPSLLIYGQAWITSMFTISQRGGIMDISLWAALERTGWFGTPAQAVIWLAVLAGTLWLAFRGDRRMSRYKAALLMAVSLLVAPYSAGNTILSLLAVGVIPLFMARPLPGLVVIALIDLPIVIPPDALRPIAAWYGTGLLLLIAGMMAWRVYREEIETAQQAAVGS